jgi:class 3 adenylate cyclase/phosphoglycerate-specific signal transduction histidine kinase
MAEMATRAVLGIKAKLFLAFCAMAALTLLAAAIAWYAFVAIERSVDGITGDSVPAMAVSLRLAEKSAEISATAPALMASADQDERIAVRSALEGHGQELADLIGALDTVGVEPATVQDLAALQGEIIDGLRAINAAVEARLEFQTRRETVSAEVTMAHRQFDEILEPVIDDAVFDLIIGGEDMTAENRASMTDLVEGGVDAIRLLLTVNAEVNLAAGLLAEAGNIDDPIVIQPIRERFLAAAAAIERGLNQLPHMPQGGLLRQNVDNLMILGTGDESLFEVRARELRTEGQTRESLRATRARMSASLEAAHAAILDILTPMVDDATFDLVISAEDVVARHNTAITSLIDGGVTGLQVLLAMRAEGNLVAGLLSEAANIPERALIQPLRERFVAAADHIRTRLGRLPKGAEGVGLREAADRLVAFGSGKEGVFEVRGQELRQVAAANELLDAAQVSSLRLGERVAELVAAAQRNSDAAAREAGQAIIDGETVLLIITAVSIVGAILIVLFYVVPSIVRPLEHITDAMTELAGGDTNVDIPARERGDEMGRMAQALGVFRDTAIEVQKANRAEIQETRTRLFAAISSISEGFSLYDREDRLVICNDKYRTMLYPDMADEIAPGMTFTEIVRRAAENGYIRDAKGRIEEWLEQRMAQHRDPGDPHVHQRADGRWILVSERRTEDGGTVALYSDITELKQREAELADKSNALEQLSNQLAKYLSPQVYESIFSGKQEVKLTSQRKKLTVFFSDIAGFTETAEKLESEDLTRLLNEYLTEMSQIALQYGATIDKYVGDAIVIFFGDPESRGVTEDACACVEMAIAMQMRMGELQETWRASGIEDPLRVRIGINTGYCTVGNFGSEDRMDYTIIGGGVNLASRLESSGTPGEILISYETYALVRDRIHCEERGQIDIKGMARPVATYVAIDSIDNLDRDRQTVGEDQTHIKLDLDLDAMSAEERNKAAAMLKQALDQLAKNQ